jgi:nucleoside-diphosphate-sugar epimerase
MPWASLTPICTAKLWRDCELVDSLLWIVDLSKVLITGAGGFVGCPLCKELFNRGYQVRAAMRTHAQLSSAGETATVGEIDVDTQWTDALRDVDTVIHTAARVHVMKDTAADPLTEFLKVNLYGTSNLAQQAARAGVKRFVYVSSVKVNGESTAPVYTLSPSPSDETTGHSAKRANYAHQVAGYPLKGEGKNAFLESDEPDPQDAYGMSKWRAEQDLQRIAKETGLEIVILRPPLVYGPGVKGNFISLLAAINRGIPLPLAGANNLRSLVYVGNLVDALITCATHPAAAGQTYLVSDGEDVSTAMLVDLIAQSLGRNSRAFNFPHGLLRAVATLLGRAEQMDRLFGSLRVNDEKLHRELAWSAPYTLEQGLRATADWYRNRKMS